MYPTHLVAAAAALVFCTTTTVAQEGVSVLSDALEIDIGGRVQTQFNTTTADGIAPTQFLFRRVRIALGLRLDDLIEARIEPEFAGASTTLADVYGALDFSPAARVLIGRTKRPFDVIGYTSAAVVPSIERGMRIRGVEGRELSGVLEGLGFSGRDIGVHLVGSLEGAPLGLGYAASLTGGPLQGQIANRITGQVTARVTAHPVEGLQLGAAWSRRPHQLLTEADAPIDWGDAFVVDLRVGESGPAPGLFLLGQVARGDLEPAVGAGFSGAQIMSGYRFAGSGRVSYFEPVINVSHASLDEGAGSPGGGTLLASGLNIYLGGRNRVMLGYEYWEETGDGAFRTQFQVVF